MTDQATSRGGKIDLGSGKAQHVDLWRKLKQRRELLEGLGPGAAYVPFLGEADIALELYTDRQIVGVELDPDVAATATRRLLEETDRREDGWMPLVIVGDAEQWHEGADAGLQFAILDVDAFANPYRALEVAWRELAARSTITTRPDRRGLAERVAIFGTDGMRLAIRQSKDRTYGPLPAGKIVRASIAAKREQWNHWWTGVVRPYLVDLVAPAVIVDERKYQRAHMLYWGIVVDRADRGAPDLDDRIAAAATDPPEDLEAPATDGSPDAIAKVEAALLEAATSGNVPAAIFWLEHKGGAMWAPTRRSSTRDMLDELTGRKR